MAHRSWLLRFLVVSGALLATARPAHAIPAFARKYETSCLTCHTVYPKLTPFGEAFRRNGYRFPGVDSDYVKQGTVALGQEANKKTFPNSVWPSTVPISSILAIGANGQAFAFPNSSNTLRANPAGGMNHVHFNLDDLVAEGHIWAGAALDDKITLWAELTFSGSADVEHAQVLFNDLFGPKHALNLTVGRGFPTLTSFGPHSSYLGDQLITNLPLTGIYGVSSDPFTLVDNYNGAEVTGVIAKGRVDYSVGLTAGKNTRGGRFNSDNVYGHVGFKLGGMRLDGEGSQGPKDALKPWSEDAVTIDAFAFHSREHSGDLITPVGGTTPGAALDDSAVTVGGAARLQLGSAELNLGGYWQDHNHATAQAVSGAGLPDRVKADVEWGELSYVVFPWLVPAVRVERIGIRPSGGTNVSDVHLMPGIAFLIRANIKAVLVGNIEFANGFPNDASGALFPWDGGNADWGNFVAAPRPTSSAGTKQNEVESIALFFAWAI